MPIHKSNRRGIPKLRNGPMEQRVLVVARRSARDRRIQTLNQIRQLIFTADEPIRVRFLGRYQKGLISELAALRPRNGARDPVGYVTLVTLRDLARRIVHLDDETTRILFSRASLGRVTPIEQRLMSDGVCMRDRPREPTDPYGWMADISIEEQLPSETRRKFELFHEFLTAALEGRIWIPELEEGE